MDNAEEAIGELLSLLDLIEFEDDASLAQGRFDIMEKYGTVTFGVETSTTKQ